MTHPSGLVLRTPDLSRARPPRWAWHDRVVLGYLNLLIGNEGVGKGTLAAWMIARLTQGELPGDLHGTPVNVGILGDEDGFDDVWTPRLYAAGADLTRVRQLERPDGGFVHITEDRVKIEAAVKSDALRVLFFDALLDNLGAGTDDWRTKAVREALQPLRALARQLDVAALGSLHPNKRAESFRQLVAGAGFNALSRSSLLLATHPDDEERRVLVRGKGNLSSAPRAVEFNIESQTFKANGHDFSQPYAVRFAESDLNVDDLLDTTERPAANSKIGEAVEIVEALLPRDGAWHLAKPIFEAAAADSIEDRTVQRAKQRLGIEHRRSAAFQASVEWRWPTRDTLTSVVHAVATVASDASEDVCTHDTHVTYDAPRERRQCVASDPDAELDRLVEKFGPA